MQPFKGNLIRTMESETKEKIVTQLIEVKYNVKIKNIDFDLNIYHKTKMIEVCLNQWNIKDQETKDLVIKSVSLLEKDLLEEFTGYKITCSLSLYPYVDDNYIPLKKLIDVPKNYYEMSYENLNLGSRTWLGIKEDGTIQTVKDLLEKTKGQLINLPHVGEPSVRDIVENLKNLK